MHRNGTSVYYLHPVLEAKLVDVRGLAISIGSEFIENPMEIPFKARPDLATLTEYETVICLTALHQGGAPLPPLASTSSGQSLSGATRPQFGRVFLGAAAAKTS